MKAHNYKPRAPAKKNIQEASVVLYYCDDHEVMEKLVRVLLKKGEWFDVRRPVKHYWSITCSAVVELPKKGLILATGF